MVYCYCIKQKIYLIKGETNNLKLTYKEDLFILDKQKDTLLRTPLLDVQLSGFSIFSSIADRKIDFKTITLNNGSFYLKKHRDSTTNLKFVLDYFDSGTPSKQKTKPWTINFAKIALNNFHFRYKNQLIDTTINGVNYDDVDITRLNIAASNLDLKNHLFKAAISNLSFKEKSGFILQKLSSVITVDTNQVELVFLVNILLPVISPAGTQRLHRIKLLLCEQVIT
ncbi:hypothetical protein EON73_05405 [bacterium]|nr:MAG: hypothetical protein EON73_05405 [bacterium]